MKKKKELVICAISILIFLALLLGIHMYEYKNGNWYLINSNGDYVSKIGYEKYVGAIEIEGEMYYLLTRKNRFSPRSRFYRETLFVVNKNGEAIFQDSTGKGGNLNCEDLHSLFYKGKRIFLDSDGKIIYTVPDNITIADNYRFCLGMMPFYNNDGEEPIYGYINTEGTIVIKPQFLQADSFSKEGLAAVENDKGKWGYIDTEGNMVIPEEYDMAWGFDEGLAKVQKDHDFFYIDTKGKNVLDIDGGIITEGYTYIENDEGKYACVDIEGKLITDYIFDWPVSFKNGYACGRVNGLFGCIDKTGEYVIEPSFEYLGDFTDYGIAAAKEKDGLYGFINIKGEWVVEPQFVDVCNFEDGNGVTLVKYPE